MIDERQEEDFPGRALTKGVFANILGRSFLTACLLTGNTTQAEKAVMEAITVWNPDEDDEEQLFQITLRKALQMQITLSPTELNEESTTNLCLPVELRRLLKLSPQLRRCFVLRVLVGLRSQVCAQALHLAIRQLDQYCWDAMENLAALDSAQRPLSSSFRSNSPERRILD